jgi:hypothetical protein
MLTGSPTLLNHRPTENLKTPAIFGTFISILIIRSFLRLRLSACDVMKIEAAALESTTPADWWADRGLQVDGARLGVWS